MIRLALVPLLRVPYELSDINQSTSTVALFVTLFANHLQSMFNLLKLRLATSLPSNLSLVLFRAMI
jgi:hypothetical protein